MIHAALLPVLCIVFVATLIRSAFGFGEALIAVPLLAFCMPLQTAAPLAVLLSITIAAVVVVQDWKQIHFLSAGWLLLATLPGLPLGLLLLTSGHPRIVRALLGWSSPAFSGLVACETEQHQTASRQPNHDGDLWILCGRAGRRVWHERSAACRLWVAPAMVAATVSGHPAGVFSSGQPAGDGRLPGHRPVDAPP